jgi:hypothetical protein
MKNLVKFIAVSITSFFLSSMLVSQANLVYMRFFDTNFGFWGTETMVTFPALFLFFTTLIYSAIRSGGLRKHIIYSAVIIGIIAFLIWLSNTDSPITFIIVFLPYTIGLIIGRVVN